MPVTPLTGDLGKADLAVLEHHGDPRALLAAGEAELTRLISTTSGKQQGHERAGQWRAAAAAAVELYDDHPAVPYGELAAEVASEVRLLRAIQAELAAHAAAREQHYLHVDPDQLARSLPGFAEISAPVLIAAMGRPGRFRDGTRFKSYVGLAPRASETGETDRKGQPMSKAGPSLLRATFVRAADTARKQDPQLAKIYYVQMTERGATHLKACCVVAGHLAERAWTVLHRGTPYVICDNNGNPVTPAAGQGDHRGEMDRARGHPQTPPQPQDSGEGPSDGPHQAGQARRPPPPPIVAAPRPASQDRHLTPAPRNDAARPATAGRPPGMPGHHRLSLPPGPGGPGAGVPHRSCLMPGHPGGGKHAAGTPQSNRPAAGQRQARHAAAAGHTPRTPA